MSDRHLLHFFYAGKALGLGRNASTASSYPNCSFRVASAAAALDQVSSINELTDAERADLAKKLGYTKIGKELPDEVTLQDIIKSMPAEVSWTSNQLINNKATISQSSALMLPYNSGL